jgi:hypothetical protein
VNKLVGVVAYDSVAGGDADRDRQGSQQGSVIVTVSRAKFDSGFRILDRFDLDRVGDEPDSSLDKPEEGVGGSKGIAVWNLSVLNDLERPIANAGTALGVGNKVTDGSDCVIGSGFAGRNGSKGEPHLTFLPLWHPRANMTYLQATCSIC